MDATIREAVRQYEGLLQEARTDIEKLLRGPERKCPLSVAVQLTDVGSEGNAVTTHLAYSLGKVKLAADPVLVGASTPDLFEGMQPGVRVTASLDGGPEATLSDTRTPEEQANDAEIDAEEAEFCGEEREEEPHRRYWYDAPEGRVIVQVECRKSQWATYYTNPKDMVPKRLNTTYLPQRDDRETAECDLLWWAEKHGLEAVEDGQI